MKQSQSVGGDSRIKRFFLYLRSIFAEQQKNLSIPTLTPNTAPRWPTRHQIRFFPYVLTPRELWAARIAAFFFVTSFLVLSVRFFQRHIVTLPREGGAYTEAMIGIPQYVNPILAYANDVDLDLTKLLFRGLYTTNELGEIVEDLATHHEVSEDGKTYVITIRQNARWHDGTPLTASDIVFTFSAMADPEYQSPRQKDFRDVGVELVDDYTVKFTLTKPYAPFLSTLTTGILPQHIWSDVPGGSVALAEYNTKPIGSGAFVFESLTKDRRGTIKSYHLLRNEECDCQKPYLNELTFRFYPTREEAVDAVRRHRADGLSYVTSESTGVLEKTDVIFKKLRLPQYTAVFFNQRNALLKEKVIRRSRERAVNKNTIIEQALGGAGEPIHSPILPGFLGYNAAIQGLAYDAVTAGKDLDNAGWALLAGETVRKKDGKELRFALSTVDRPEYMKTAELLRDAWAAIGVSIELRVFSSNDILKKVIKPRDYEALLFGEIVGVDPDPYPFWHSTQSYDPGLNLAIFYNKQVDQLLEEARQTTDPEQRQMKYLHFQNILADEQPAVFLYNPLYTYALPEKLKGFAIQRISIPSDRFNDIAEWYIKTRLGWQ